MTETTRVFPEPSELFRRVNSLEAQIVKLELRLKELEAKFEEIRQHPLVYMTYNPESKADLDTLRRRINEMVDRST